MQRTTVIMCAAAVLVVAAHAEAQGRRDLRYDRQDIARLQGVPPGQLPPPDRCRVWFDNRPNGHQPAPTDCRQAELLAARDRRARVVYGENAFWDQRDNARGGASGGWSADQDRAVRRDGRVRDPRISDGIVDYRRDAYWRNSAAYDNGYRDGMTKGRDDGEDGDAFDADRHNWYRSATRGYDDDEGTKNDYQAAYRRGFEAGYAEGYRVYMRR